MKKTILFLSAVMAFASCGSDAKKENTTEAEKTSKVEEAKKEEATGPLKFDKSSFNFSITGYGGENKSYVVSQIVFKEFEVTSSENLLLGTSLSFNPGSIDTSKEMGNGTGGEWPAAFAEIRNGNIVNGFVNHMAEKESVLAEITSISDDKIELKATINGVSKVIEMTYTVNADGILSAKGELDVLDFNTSEAFESFGKLCTAAFHQGTTWSEVGLAFSVAVK